MTDDVPLAYERLSARKLTLDDNSLSYYSKPGVRAYPEPHPGARLMLERAKLEGERLTDMTATAGLVALGVAAEDKVGLLHVLEPSQAALRCAAKTLELWPQARLTAALPWLRDEHAEKAEVVTLLPHTDRGNARVQAEIDAAHAALFPEGRLYVVMHKDQGAKRYEGLIERRFGSLDVLAKSGGWRLVRARKRRLEEAPVGFLPFEAAGLSLEAYPGVFAAGKLDPGSALLLRHIDWDALAGKQVLDLGCGYGLLTLLAARAGAVATGVDDDLAAVLSSRRNAGTLGVEASFVHSDIDAALENEARFDAVLMNPPFHVGKKVDLTLPHAFLAAARRRLKKGGVLTLVANKALPYEADLASWSAWQQLEQGGAFKVLRAVK